MYLKYHHNLTRDVISWAFKAHETKLRFQKSGMILDPLLAKVVKITPGLTKENMGKLGPEVSSQLL